MHVLLYFSSAVAAGPGEAFAKDSVRLVVIEAEAGIVGSVRAALRDPAKISEPDAIDPLLKRKGVTLHSDFRRDLEWGRRVERFSKPTGVMKNSDGREFGTWLRFHPGKHDTSVFDNVDGGLDLGRGNSFHGLSIDNSQMATIPGTWVERVCWGDEKVSRMVWQYGVVDGFEEVAKARPDATFKSLRVQLLWFRASKDESAKLNAADQETRVQAVEWLKRRGKLWRECGFWNRTGQATRWHDINRKWERNDGEAVEEANGDALSIEGYFTGPDEKLEIKLKANAIFRGKYTNLGEFTANSETGDWVFLPVEGFEAASVIACRLSKD